MDKVIKDGKVAVLYSPGYGAGWSTWNEGKYPLAELIFDPVLVNLILAEATQHELTTYAENKWPEAYLGGLRDLSVTWVPVGTQFRVTEYDGFESVEVKEDDLWITA